MASFNYQPQQPGVPAQPYPQYGQQQQAPRIVTVPPHLQRPMYHLSITQATLGAISVLFGIVSLIVRFYGVANWTGVNLWVGIMYATCGALGISHHKSPTNPSLLHAFYAFSIIGLIFSIPQISIAIAALTSYGVLAGGITVAFGLLGFSLSTAFVVILSQHIYCSQNAQFNQAQYATVTVGQPGAVIYQANPAMPHQQVVFTQQMPAGGMAQPVPAANPQVPVGGMTQPFPATNPQPTVTTNEKPPIV